MKNNNYLAILINRYLDQPKNKKIFSDKNCQLDIEQVKNHINHFSKNLYKLSKKKKKNLIIGIFLERNVYYLISIFACWITGATIVPLNKNWPKKHLDEIKKKLSFDYILVDEKKKN